ncbi:unnamed protein product, partial [Arctogadus glacialis]
MEEMSEESQTGKRKRQRMSKVWDNFTLRTNEKTVVCVHCKTELAYHSSTTSMLQHLEKKHPFYSADRRPETRVVVGIHTLYPAKE